MKQEIIALLVPAGKRGKPSRKPPVEALVRREDGQVVIEQLRDGRAIGNSPWFRQGPEILDPDTREVIGYELEPVTG